MTPKASAFIHSVLQLRANIAVFDCDGTLWGGDAGEGFFDWELTRGLVSDETVRWARARYADYRAGKVSEDDMCGEMATINRGLLESEVLRESAEFFDQSIAAQVFPDMKELVLQLQNAGCEVWAVSSTNEWVIRVAMRHFKVQENRILAASVEIEDGKITDRIIRIPSGPGKPQAIYDVIGRAPDMVFGNSVWDADMLAIARHPFVINPTEQLAAIAAERHWPVYQPDAVALS